MGFGTHLFDCAICGKEVRDILRNGRERHLEPLCRYCEGYYADRGPTAGAFMDRRKARQISALANALSGFANTMQWKARHGYS